MKIMIRNALTDDATTIAGFNALMAMETEGKALEQPLIGATACGDGFRACIFT